MFKETDNHRENNNLGEQRINELKERQACRSLAKFLDDSLKGSEFLFTTGWHIHRRDLICLLKQSRVGIQQRMKLIGPRNETVHRGYSHDSTESSLDDRRQTMKKVNLGVQKGVRNTAPVVRSTDSPM